MDKRKILKFALMIIIGAALIFNASLIIRIYKQSIINQKQVDSDEAKMQKELFNKIPHSDILKIRIITMPYAEKYSISNIDDQESIIKFKNTLSKIKSYNGSISRRKIKYGITVYFKNGEEISFFLKSKMRSGEQCDECKEKNISDGHEIEVYAIPIQEINNWGDEPISALRVCAYFGNDFYEFMQNITR